MWWNDLKEIKETLAALTIRFARLEDSIIDIINEKIDPLINDGDKFEDYMKNVDRINSMMNEFKGCVAMARSALQERKELDEQTEETKKLANISAQIYKSMIAFIKAAENMQHVAHFKIDSIYKAVCQHEEKKSAKTPSKIKKVSPAP